MKAQRIPEQHIRACASKVHSDWLALEMCVRAYCHNNPIIRWLFWSRQDKALDLARLEPNETVLDYGCGLGIALPTLARLAKQVVAIDTDVSGGQHMAQLYRLENIRFIDQADQLTRLVEEIAPGSIDCVTALDVFEHIDDLESVVRVLHTILSSRGRVIISGPTESWAYRLGRRLAGFTKIAGYGVENPFHKTDISTIRTLFSQRGFRLVRDTILPPWPLPTAFVLLRFEPITNSPPPTV